MASKDNTMKIGDSVIYIYPDSMYGKRGIVKFENDDTSVWVSFDEQISSMLVNKNTLATESEYTLREKFSMDGVAGDERFEVMLMDNILEKLKNHFGDSIKITIEIAGYDK